MKIFLTTVLILFFSRVNYAQTYTQNDADICSAKYQLAADNKLSTKPINEIIIAIGKSFIGTDYAANTLEAGDKENLVINLSGLDCYTFLESTLAFSRCIKAGKTSFKDFLNEIINLRYRNGELMDYTSRLHYFSDWIYDMNNRGIGKDISKELGGIPYSAEVNFMSTHPNSYKRLKNNEKFIEEIAAIEKEINKRKYYFIPQIEIEKKENKINSGDIIGITTNINGLDISHTGIAYRAGDGRIYLMHAPNVGYKVQITEKPLADYIKGNKKQTGIIILRPLDVH